MKGLLRYGQWYDFVMYEPRTSTNLFDYKCYCKEDFISVSLAYVANLFPREVGGNWVRRIETKAGLKRGSLGRFVRCEFVGHSYGGGGRASKPDLAVHTDRRIVLVEVKVDSPLNRDQLTRHLVTAEKYGKSAKLIFLSNVQYRLSELVASERFLKPSDRDHFVWADFEQAFAPSFRQGTVHGRIVKDLRLAMKTSGLLGRSIPEAEGSIYTEGSAANRYAIDELHKILKAVGYDSRRHSREHTLRVYPRGYGDGLLVNPRFKSTGEDWNPTFNDECIITKAFNCKPFGIAKTWHPKMLGRVAVGTPFSFDNHAEGERFGVFYLPLRFAGSRIDFGYLGDAYAGLKAKIDALRRD